MRPEKTLGMELRTVMVLMERKMNSIIVSNGVEDITPMHGMILGYLHHNQESAAYQRDIESEFQVTRSTVTSLLKLMEKKGYIRREGVSHDARLKRLSLTPKGEDSFRRIEASIGQSEELLRTALLPAEYAQLMGLLTKIKAVL